MFAILAVTASAGVQAQSRTTKVKAQAQARALPLVFEENAGQLGTGTLFAGRTQQYSVELQSKQMRFDLLGEDAGRAITLTFSGAKDGRPEGVTSAGFLTNYYIGSDQRTWHTGVKNFDRVALRALYPGIDAEFYSHSNQIEHDFILAPGADAGQLSMHLAGAGKVVLTDAGDLDLNAKAGYLRLHKPNAYQLLADGTRQPVPARFSLVAHGNESDLSFVLGDYDHSRQLVIDPVISYATYVAGSVGSTPTGITSDAAGNAYITGTTSSTQTSFGAAATTVVPAPPATLATPLVFIAGLAESALGSQIKWLSYYGTGSQPVQSNAIALQAANNVLYVGGQTVAAASVLLPLTSSESPATGFGRTSPATAGSTVGFVATFHADTGKFITGAYVEASNGAIGATTTTTYVSSLLANGNGVYMVGAATGTNLVPAAPLPGGSQLISLTSPLAASTESSQFTVINSTSQKGFIVELDLALQNELYATYVNGYINPSVTTLTGVAVDSSQNIYISGHTNGDFPKSGIDSPSLANPNPPNPWTIPSSKVGDSSFAAEIKPSTATILYSYWTGGTKNDVINGLALDSTNELYLFGLTDSSPLPSAAQTSSQASGPSGTATIPFNSAFPAGAVHAGFVTKLDSNGFTDVATYLSGDTGSHTTVQGGVVDSSGNVYAAGTTDTLKANFPQVTAGGAVASNLLPPTEDVSADNPSARSFLLKMPTGLDSVNYVGFFGPANGTSAAAGVTVDALTPTNAYILNADTPAAGSSSFTLASAIQMAPQTTAGPTSAYLAQVSFAVPGPVAALTAGTQSYTVTGSSATPPPPVAYLSSTVYSSLTLKYQVTAGSAGASTVVFNLPANANLQPYTGLPVVLVANSPVTGVCTLGTTASSGYTCVLPTLAAGATAEFDIAVAVGPGAPASNAGFTVTPTVYDAQGDTLSTGLALTIATAGIPTFTVTNTATPATVNAALSSTDTVTPNTAVTYTFSIQNTSANDSPLTTLSTNLSSSTYVFTPVTTTLSANLAGCDISTTACLVSAGQTATYSVTGVYQASDFGSSTSGPFTSLTTAPTVTFASPLLNTPPVATGTSSSVNIQANTSLAVNVVTSATTFNNGFRLGDTGVQITAQIKNTGPNQASGGSVTITLPTGFVPTAPASCVANPAPTSCTLNFTTIAGGATANVTVTGTFSDTGTTADAVAPPATTAGTPTAATVSGSATSASVKAQVLAGGLSLSSGYYSAAPAAASTSILVSRSNTLGYNIVAATTQGSGKVNETNPTNASDPNSFVTYTVTVQNTGVSVARGILFSIPVPLPTNVTLSAVSAVTYTTTGGAIDTPSMANQLTCATYVAGSSSITCYSNDLNTAPSSATTTPAAQAYTLSFTATYNELTVPLTTAAGTTVIPQSTGSVIAAAVYPAVNPSVSPANITVQRQTAVAQTLVRTRVGSAPAKFADTTDINLDEHVAANAAGVNDTLTFSLSTSNAGPNDAAGVSFSVPLPAYANILGYPATCQIAGNAGSPTSLYTTGASGASMTCTPTSTTTAAGTATGQIAAATNACTGSASTNTSFDGKCFVVSFSLKFVDAASNATIVGASPKVPVAFSAATATGSDVDAGAALASLTPATLTVQRAAHVRLTSTTIPVPTYTDGVTSTGSIVAQAAIRMSPTTFAATTGKVYNCFRYTVSVVNDGPNYANTAALNYALNLGGYVSTQKAVGTPPTSPNAVDCVGLTPSGTALGAGAAQSQSVGSLSYASGTAVISLDGYFDVGTLGTSNVGTSTFQTSAFTASDYNDSNVPATTGADYKGTQSLSVVNTPFNNAATSGFGITPYGSATPVAVVFSQVDVPGVTKSSLSTTAAVTMPSGKSTYPPDGGAVKALYQTGIHPAYYNINSTATSAVATNPTGVCILPPVALADVFIKPERALLWALLGSPAGTAYNTVPNITSTGSLAGDVTLSVASSGAAYVTKPATIKFPQAPQAQPAQVCGKLNGVPGTAGTTLSVLEPVNFAPFVSGGAVPVAVQTGKGATSANSDVYLLIGTGLTHDYNDKDPCYVAGARAVCDDNPYMYAMTFGGGNTGALPEISLPVLVSSLTTPETNVAGGTFLATGFNLGTATTVYISVFDQTTGADSYNTDIPSNPYSHEGAYLTGNLSAAQTAAATDGTVLPICDPGYPSIGYTLSKTACANTNFTTSTQRAVNGSGPTGGPLYAATTVGASAVQGTGISGSGLIGLPFPDLTTPPTSTTPTGAPFNPGGSVSVPLGLNPTTGATTAAIAYITPGQTAGFLWAWISSPGVAVGASAGDQYALGCVLVDNATQSVVQSVPAGITCTITTSTPSSPTASAQTYTLPSLPSVFPVVPGSTAPTVFVITNGTLYGSNSTPVWQRTTGGLLLACVLPLFFFRRRIGRAGVFLMALLTLAAAPMLSGCGSGLKSTGSVAPSASYLFRVTATPITKPANPTITTAPFQVVVQKAN